MSSVMDRLEERIERLRNPVNLALFVARDQREFVDQLERAVAKLHEGADALAALLKTDRPGSLLLGPEREMSFALAVEGLAKARGGAIFTDESFAIALVEHAPEEHRAYWSHQSPPKVFGLLRWCAHIREALEARNVLLWHGEDDRLIRLVHTEWCTDDEAKHGHVTAAWPGGRVCRFCRIQEPSESYALEAVEPDKRRTLDTMNRVAQLQPRTVYTHAQCRPHWLRYVERAARFRKLEQAS